MSVRESTRGADYKPEAATQRDRGRDAEQKDIDERTRKLITDWDAASQPAPANGKYAGPTIRFDVDDKAAGKRRVGRSFTLVSKERKEHKTEDGKPSPLAPYNLRAFWFKDSEPDSEGWVTIQYGVALTAEKSDGEAETSQETPAESNQGESQGESQEAPQESQEAPQEQASGRGGFRRR